MQKKQNLKHFFLVFTISLVLIFLLLRMVWGVFSTKVNHFFIYRENVSWLNLLYEYQFTPSTDKIAIITIDEDTINQLQAWSFLKMVTIPKTTLITAVEKLQSVGVKGIAFDIIFQNPDNDEERFVEELKKYQNIVISRSIDRGLCRQDADGKYEVCEGVPRSVYADIPQGLIDVNPTLDRKTGKVWEETVSGEVYYETLALALYNRSKTGSRIDVPPDREVLTPFFGTGNTYPRVSLYELIQMSKVDLVKNFAGKYIFIGESGTLIHDAHIAPPSGELMDGVETHAHFLDGLLQGRSLQIFGLASPLFWLLIFSLLIFSVILYMSVRLSISIGYFLTVMILTLFLSRYLYFHAGWIVEVLPIFLATSLITLPVAYMYRYFIVDREKNLLAEAFSRYVDPEVVREIREKNVSIELGGESRELTILFSDIAGFTTLSEKTPIKDLFLLMSSYLSDMTKILINRGGTLDKYIGDAIMGFYGAPILHDDHAVRACITALEMRQALPAFNAELQKRSLEPIDFRVGIASGEVMVGNIGSKDRFNYTVLGDTVNLASRLEATSKEYGTHIIVSEGTYEKTKKIFTYRKLDLITVKGKTEPIGIYELIWRAGEDLVDGGIYDEYARALDLYMRWDYLGAGTIWESQMNIDPASKTMALRCVDILKGYVTVENGVYHMTKK